MFSFFKSLLKSTKQAVEHEGPNGLINNVFVPRNLERISKKEAQLQSRQLKKHVLIDMSVKGNHDCMSCGENIAYYTLGPEEKSGNWPAYHSLHVECECGHDTHDIIDAKHTQEEIENTVRYVWNELNDFEGRMRELRYND